MPTAEQLLKQARIALAEVETPALDARLLLQWASGLSHEQLVADPGLEISDAAASRFEDGVRRRRGFEPVSRILGQRDFYGRVFDVSPDVLDPRGDTEVLVEACLGLMDKDMEQSFIDLGSGSGIIAITLLAERPLARGVAVDVSPAALGMVRQNAGRHGVLDRLQCVESHWFSGVQGLFDIVVSNPPYIPSGDIAGLEVDVRNHDPHLALDGGADGLSCYRGIAAGAGRHLKEGGSVLVEIGAGQAEDVTGIFVGQGYQLAIARKDLGNHIRVLAFQL